MLTNGKVLRIDTPGPATATGDVSLASGPAVSIDCCLDEPTRQQRYAMEAQIGEATAVLYAEVDDLGPSVAPGCRVVAQVEGQAAQTYRVVYVRARVKDSLAVYEVFLRAA